MGKIFANYMSDKESISKLAHEFTQLNHQEAKSSIKIWTGHLNRLFSFFKRRHRDDQQANENLKNEDILSITEYKEIQGNANQNQSETTLQTCQNGYYQKKRNNKWWQRCGERGTLVHCWRECKRMQPLGETVWSF